MFQALTNMTSSKFLSDKCLKGTVVIMNQVCTSFIGWTLEITCLVSLTGILSLLCSCVLGPSVRNTNNSFKYSDNQKTMEYKDDISIL